MDAPLHLFDQVRFELKTDKGSFMVSLEPPAEELLFPQSVSRAEFQRVLQSLEQMDRDSVECQASKFQCWLTLMRLPPYCFSFIRFRSKPVTSSMYGPSRAALGCIRRFPRKIFREYQHGHCERSTRQWWWVILQRRSLIIGGSQPAAWLVPCPSECLSESR